jgi:hypothetical protein
MVDLLEGASDFVGEMIESGGSISVIINLAGDTNIGDAIPWRCLERLAALKVDLGIEVFPKFD